MLEYALTADAQAILDRVNADNWAMLYRCRWSKPDAERVVPELADRITDWLDGLSELPGPGRSPAGSAVEDPSRRRAVISAHSMSRCASSGEIAIPVRF